MDDFKGHEKIILKESDNNVLYTFEHTVTSATTTSGYLPSGANLSAVTTTSYKISGGDLHEVDDLIVDSQIAPYNNTYVLANLKFPATNGTGRYGILFEITYGASKVKTSWFANIWAVNADGSL